MTGQYGNEPLYGGGTASWFGDPEVEINQTDWELHEGNWVKVQYKGTITVTPDPNDPKTGTSEFEDLDTWIGGKYSQISGKDNYTTDKDGKVTCKWKSVTVKAVAFQEGNVPFGGGDGDYTVRLTAVPEPSALLLFGSGALGLIGFLRKRISL